MWGRPHATVSPRPVAAIGPPPIAGVTGWAPLPGTQNPSQQIGAFAGQRLNQWPANVPGVQLHSGHEGNNAHWYTPTLTAIPNGSLQQTQRPNNLPGGQRDAVRYTGPIGPLSARRNAVLVAAAQVRQSGLAALGWAHDLGA